MNSYRVFIIDFLSAGKDIRQVAEIQKNLDSNPMAQCLRFSCEEKDLGAYVRAALWTVDISFGMIVNGKATCLVQKELDRPFTWEVVSNGMYDCAELLIGRGR